MLKVILCLRYRLKNLQTLPLYKSVHRFQVRSKLLQKCVLNSCYLVVLGINYMRYKLYKADLFLECISIIIPRLLNWQLLGLSLLSTLSYFLCTP